MPTPFYHLNIAGNILRQAELPPEAAFLREEQRAAFLFGNTAPDVQSVSQQGRAETHFLELPYQEEAALPWEAFWQKMPALHTFRTQPPDRQAFIAGYLCHLQADWLWLMEIFLPHFEYSAWAPHHERMVLHNVLRSYLDARMQTVLPPETGEIIASVNPQGWLPFVEDRHLAAWRDQLSRQLLPGAAWQTVEVFAARQHVAPQVYYDLLASEERMESQVFSHISRQSILAYDALLLAANLNLIKDIFP